MRVVRYVAGESSARLKNVSVLIKVEAIFLTRAREVSTLFAEQCLDHDLVCSY